jgi:hypothetical protein
MSATSTEKSARYRATAKGKAAVKRYNASDKGKAAAKRHNDKKYPTGSRLCVDCGSRYHTADVIERGWKLINTWGCLCDLCDLCDQSDQEHDDPPFYV